MLRLQMSRLRLRDLTSLVASGLLGGTPAGAQPADPLGVRGEFGAFVSPIRAEEMIRECDARTQRLQQDTAGWRAAMARYKTDGEAYLLATSGLQTADARVAEAESALRTATGADVGRLSALVTQRREQAAIQERVLIEAAIRYEDAWKRADAQKLALVEILRVSSVPEADRAKPDAERLILNQTDRCQRMRAWARLGRMVERGALAQPGTQATREIWPESAVSAWRGQWSCRWSSTVQGNTLAATVTARVNAWSQTDGTVLVHLSTDYSAGWSGYRPSHVFSPLVVRMSQPSKGAFANRDGAGEERARYDAVDAASLSKDGQLTFRRSYRDSPDALEEMVCTRTGPLQPER